MVQTAENAQTQNPVSNLEYDFLTVLHNKAEAIKAYETYINDAQQAGSRGLCRIVSEIAAV